MSRAPRPLVLDTGALIALERGDAAIRGLLGRAAGAPRVLLVPATVVAQARRDGAHQARVARLLGAVTVPDLDAVTARAVGVLLGRAGASDVVDAHVALRALRRDAAIVTSDAGDLGRLAPDTPLILV